MASFSNQKNELKDFSAELKFMGPAQQQFTSFQEQANYFLDYYWPDWKNYKDPKCYIIPPTFKFKHSEVSDQNFEKFNIANDQIKVEHSANGKTSKPPPEVISDRLADNAEHQIFQAIEQVIENGAHAPFIAIRGLDLCLNIKEGEMHGRLTKIFPDMQWDYFQELMKLIFGKDTPNVQYDFILIGPKIGIIVIEVKSSIYKKPSDFKARNRYLPNGFEHGLLQLESSTALIYLLQEASKISVNNKNIVSKVLFTPNVTNTRYQEWITTLANIDQIYLQEKTKSVNQWFHEDSNPPERLQNRFQDLLENCKPISKRLYESYAQLLAAMSSVTIFSTSSTISRVQLDRLNFSVCETALKENQRLLEQNPLENRKSQKLATASHFIKSSKETKAFTNVYFLSPDQQKALDGPQFQFIIGVAGTGKTIVLQTKACKLLANGESVVVLTMKNCMWRYKAIFDHCGFQNYTIYDLEVKTAHANQLLKDHLNCCLKRDQSITINNDLVKLLGDFVEIELQKQSKRSRIDCIEDSLKWLTSLDNVIMDDAFDTFSRSHRLISYFILRYLQKVLKSKNVCWIAMDPCRRAEYSTVVDAYRPQIITHLLTATTTEYSVTILKQVMRCSSNIFNSVYVPAMNDPYVNFPVQAKPVLGHKFQGVKITKITGHFSNCQKAQAALWITIKSEIQQFLNQEIRLSNVAIVLDICPFGCYRFLRNKIKKEWPDLYCCSAVQQTTDTNSHVDLSINKDFLIITKWQNVSSLEWPIIINLNLLSLPSSEYERERLCYRNYRATSRATAKLTDITFTYNAPPQKSWRKSELDLLIILYKKYFNVPIHQTTSPEYRTWKNLCDEFNKSNKFNHQLKRNTHEIRNKIMHIYCDCKNYWDLKAKGESVSLKPPYYDVFEDIFASSFAERSTLMNKFYALSIDRSSNDDYRENVTLDNNQRFCYMRKCLIL